MPARGPLVEADPVAATALAAHDANVSAHAPIRTRLDRVESAHAVNFLDDRFSGVADITGVESSTTRMLAIIDWLFSQPQPGGMIIMPRGRIYLPGFPMIKNDGAAVPQQPFLRITGQGGFMQHRNTQPLGGTILGFDTPVAEAPAYIDTRGAGTLELDHLSLVKNADDTVPFIQTTNTTPNFHDLGAWGHSSKSGINSRSDFIRLGGGKGPNLGQGQVDARFQGYGGSIRRIAGNRIRRLIHGFGSVNDMVIDTAVYWVNCGHAEIEGDTSSGCAIYIEGQDPGTVSNGNRIIHLLVESIYVPYGVRLQNAQRNWIAFPGFYDAHSNNHAKAFCRFESGAPYNVILAGFYDQQPRPDGYTPTLISEDPAVKDTTLVIDPTAAQPSRFRRLRVQDLEAFGGLDVILEGSWSGDFRVQPATAGNNGNILVQFLRSALEAADPSKFVWGLRNAGGQWLGEVTTEPATDADRASFYVQGGALKYKTPGTGVVVTLATLTGDMAPTAGKGLYATSADGTKQGRFYWSDAGEPMIEAQQ